jgi:hypothetical protein
MTGKSEGHSDVNELVTAYHRYGATSADEDFWAWERVGEIVRGADPERAWELAVALVRASTDERLGYIGAGPIEDLVYWHGLALIDWIEGEAKRDPRFREALASIWLVADDIPKSVLSRLQAATGHQILAQTQAEIDAANEGLTPNPSPRDA